ncbi:MAG: translation initiation factor IF-2 [Saprospiraceae bacterium]|jgi:translation initiation factor IF-2
MARLVKVAKEFNIGTSTIVEFLSTNGVELENKPTAKVTDEMYNMLRKEFSNSRDEKQQADKLIIGSRLPIEEVVVAPAPKIATPPAPPVVEVPVVKEVVVEKVIVDTPTPPVEVETTPDVKQPVVAAPKVDTPKEEKPKVETPKEETPKVETPKEEKPKVETPKEEKPTIGLKVIDKIDLNTVKKKAPKKKAPKKPVPTPTPTPAPKEIKEATPAASKAPVEEMMRAKTPQLAGLKVMGKIDAAKLKEKPKKEKPKPAPAAEKTKRKRTRRKITADNYKGGAKRNDRGRVKKKTVDLKQVSAKEIEEKIKATMARISGGKSNRRQKIRRDSRDVKRERQEEIDQETENLKIQVTEFISVSEFASLMDLPPTDIIMACMNMGVIVSINQRLDAEIIELVAEEFNREIEFISAEEVGDEEEEIKDDPKDLEPRAPIVTVMGHVDHGKTSLLDYIRKATVAEGEAGGITQHIGAYEVKVNDKKITFLDTPGHEAFTAMRARGAKVTDVAIIIVAADDRIMPQTKEAISHAQAAGVPMVFAINKIDKDGANPNRIKEELSAMNILVEEWGGKFQSNDISAKTGEGIDDLLEKVILESELLELQANPNRNASGTVIEASLDKGRGYVTKILVQSGTLSIGDVVVAGGHSGKVKALYNEKGKQVKKVGPSSPVLLLGLSGAPQAGEKFKEVDTDQEARQIASKRQQIEREQSNRANKRISLDEIGRRLALGSFKELNLIIKGDVDGSVEALSDALIKLSVDTVQVNVIHKAVGPIAESDVLLASASDAIVIGFQVRPSSGARQLAEREGVEIKTYSIIYETIDEIRAAIEGMLDTIKEERITCEVAVRETFSVSKVGTIAGCYVDSGVVTRKTLIRIIRDGIVIYPNKAGVKGELSSLKRFKDDAKEVKAGFECGLTVKNFNDLKIDDIIEGYEIVEIKQKLEKNR